MYHFEQSKGVVDIGTDGIVSDFREKSDIDDSLINIGFMVFEKQIFDYLDENSDEMPFEKEPLKKLVGDKQLAGYIHKGYWQCMDTLRDKEKLDVLISYSFTDIQQFLVTIQAFKISVSDIL